MHTHLQNTVPQQDLRVTHDFFLDAPVLITGDKLTGAEPEVRKAKEPCKQNPTHERE